MTFAVLGARSEGGRGAPWPRGKAPLPLVPWEMHLPAQPVLLGRRSRLWEESSGRPGTGVSFFSSPLRLQLKG